MRQTPTPVLVIGYFVILLSLVRLLMIVPQTLEMARLLGHLNDDLFTVLALRVLTLLLTVLSILIAYNLLSGKNWARQALVATGFFNLGIVGVFTNDPGTLLKQIVVYGVITYFLFFDKKIDSFFKTNGRAQPVNPGAPQGTVRF